MKKRIFMFLLLVVCGLLVAPLVNIVLNPRVEGSKWHNHVFLYNMYNLDFAARWQNFILYQLGISTHSHQVVIGHEGWLYLGDEYEQSRTSARNGQTAADLAVGEKIGQASQAWETWLLSKGVRLFRVMVGPNKESIYPEHLPSWAMPASPSAVDALFASTGAKRFIDFRPPLLAAKTQYSQALYFKTDSHWNSLGSGVAFNAFAQSVGPSAPELHWPRIEASNVVPFDGGDLTRLLRIKQPIDSNATVKILGPSHPIEITQYDFDSNQVIQKGGNPMIGPTDNPILVVSEGALNTKKLLWLRDSYGSALSPFMAATFSETIQLSWREALKHEGRFVELVEKWQPDYVFLTVVEMKSRSELFTLPPPSPLSKVDVSISN